MLELFLKGFEYVHRLDFPKDDNHAGLTMVRPESTGERYNSREERLPLPLTQTRDVRTTSVKTIYSGGGTFAITEEGWMKTSSAIPKAL